MIKGLALVVGPALAVNPKCDSSVYEGTNFYDNLIAAAVVDGGTNLAPTARASLYATLYDGGYPLTPETVPAANPFLAEHLGDTDNSCATCAYKFYSDVVPIVQFWHDGNPRICGDAASPGTPGQYDGWAYIISTQSDTSLMHNHDCVSAIQAAIDAFNLCASNGIDIKTGELNIMCTPRDLLELDATYAAYTVMMKNALMDIAFPAGFADAYTTLPCRECFDEFMGTISAAKEVLAPPANSPGPCGKSDVVANLNLFDNSNGKCLAKNTGTVFNAVKALEVCTGTGYPLNTLETYHPSDDDKNLYAALKPYEAVVSCGSRFEVFDWTYVPGWISCMEGHSPFFKFPGLFESETVTAFGFCLQYIASVAMNPNEPSCGAPGVFGTSGTSSPEGCVFAMNHTQIQYFSGGASAFDQFFQCSGMDLNTETTVCNATSINSVVHKSYVPVMEIALAEASPVDVVGAVDAFADIMDVVGDLPCGSCYAKLGAELNFVMTDDDKNLCLNPYAPACAASHNVSEALVRFETCAGYELTSDSANLCSAAEWTVLENANLQKNAFNLLLPSVTTQLTQAQFHLAQLLAPIKAANPDMQFRCEHCLEVFITDFYALPASVKNACMEDINSRACFQGDVNVGNAGATNINLAALAFQKFSDCSGYDFAFGTDTTTEAPVTTEAATSGATTETPTTAEPTTTKGATFIHSASAMVGTLLALAVAAL